MLLPRALALCSLVWRRQTMCSYAVRVEQLFRTILLLCHGSFTQLLFHGKEEYLAHSLKSSGPIK